ncbi:hypothetical protein P7K49_036554 [Saguinus oedipus]|uniref:Uncharacterized protein n=1 Tax=Saguinus oedipus TaxID=9490 RepID=A0ABQ9TKM3_SAGOE|nr:hypothetical protein P7K49_036554 [Saguinus oedipus]
MQAKGTGPQEVPVLVSEHRNFSSGLGRGKNVRGVPLSRSSVARPWASFPCVPTLSVLTATLCRPTPVGAAPPQNHAASRSRSRQPHREALARAPRRPLVTLTAPGRAARHREARETSNGPRLRRLVQRGRAASRDTAPTRPLGWESRAAGNQRLTAPWGPEDGATARAGPDGAQPGEQEDEMRAPQQPPLVAVLPTGQDGLQPRPGAPLGPADRAPHPRRRCARVGTATNGRQLHGAHFPGLARTLEGLSRREGSGGACG